MPSAAAQEGGAGCQWVAHGHKLFPRMTAFPSMVCAAEILGCRPARNCCDFFPSFVLGEGRSQPCTSPLPRDDLALPWLPLHAMPVPIPCMTSRSLAALTGRSAPGRTMPSLSSTAATRQASPSPAWTCLDCLARPCHCAPDHVMPCLDCHARPCQTGPVRSKTAAPRSTRTRLALPQLAMTA